MAGCRRKPPTARAASARRTFVVDPIDGTRAFLEGRDLVRQHRRGRGRRTARRRARMPGQGRDSIGRPERGGGSSNGGRTSGRPAGRSGAIAGPKPMIDADTGATGRRRPARCPIFPRSPTGWPWSPTATLDATLHQAERAMTGIIAAADLILARGRRRMCSTAAAVRRSTPASMIRARRARRRQRRASRA